jgi:hypothetical protein
MSNAMGFARLMLLFIPWETIKQPMIILKLYSATIDRQL